VTGSAAPAVVTTPGPSPPCTGQRFDAASFIGGIVLCGCVVAVIFFAVKFYQTKTESRYHQF
jgi:CD164 antigen